MANFSNTSEFENNETESNDTDTDIAIAALVLDIVFCLANQVLLYFLIKVVQREDLVVGQLLEYYAKFNIVSSPLVHTMVDGVVGLSSESTISGHWSCAITYFVTYFWFMFNANFSFMVACMLYVIFIHKDRAESSEKQFIKNLFCCLSFVIPLIIVVISIPLPMHQASHKLPWIEKCYGVQVNRDVILCSFDDNQLRHQYGNWSNVANFGLQASCLIELSCLMIFTSNIPGAILYLILYFHIKS